MFGVQHELTVRLPQTCSTCGGQGRRPGTTPITCSVCRGAGEVRRVRQSILGQMVTATPAQRCGGDGEEIPSPCPDCRGEGRRPRGATFVVDVPAGSGRGLDPAAAGPGRRRPARRARRRPVRAPAGAGPPDPDPAGRRPAGGGPRGDDPGGPRCQLALRDPRRREELAIPGGTQSGREIRLRGRGVPHLQARGRGDLIVTVVVDTPTDLTKEQEELLRRLAEPRGEEVAPPEAGFMSKLRGAFK